MKYDIEKLKSDIKHAEGEQRLRKASLREAQRELSAHDKLPEKDRSWKERCSLCVSVGCLIAGVAGAKDGLTLLYQARASLCGRLHMTKRIVHRSDGTKTVEALTLESQAVVAESVLCDYEIEEAKVEANVAKPAT